MYKYILIGLLFFPLIALAQLTVPQGGTGKTAFPLGALIYSDTSLRLNATSSPTVGFITATSTTATSTFAGNGYFKGNLQVDGKFFAPAAIVSSGNATINGTLTVTSTITSNSLSSGFVGSNAGTLYSFATSTLGFLSSYDAFTHPSAGQSATTSLMLFNGGASTTAFSTLDGIFVGRTATTSIFGSATSTFGAGIQTIALNITSTTATSTFANGISLSNGCFAINGTCLSSGASLSGTTGQIAYFSGTNTAVGTSTLFMDTASRVGIGTTTPNTALTVRSTGANGINLDSDAGSAVDSGRLFFSNATAGQGISVRNNAASLLFGISATPGSSSGTEMLRLTQFGGLQVNTVNALAYQVSTQLGVSTTTTSVFAAVSTQAPGSGSGAGMSGLLSVIPTAADQRLGFYTIGAMDGANNFGNSLAIQGFSSQTWSSNSARGSYLTFATTPNNSITRAEVMRLDQNGRVGIGTTTPWGLLSVQGTTNPIFVIATSTGNAVFRIDSKGHTVSVGPDPTISSCGSGPTIVGNDRSGAITVGSGVITSCAMTFATAYVSAPSCTMTINTTAVTGGITAISTTDVTFSFSATLGGGIIYYNCIQSE